MSTLFIDESKANGYLMVATWVPAHLLAQTRKDVRSLALSGQKRIHFTKENDSRRKQILNRWIQLRITSYVVQCEKGDARDQRAACLREILEIAEVTRADAILLERDESIEKADRKLLAESAPKYRLKDEFRYDWLSPHEEPMLWVSDGIAWSYAKGGSWRAKINPMIEDVLKVSV